MIPNNTGGSKHYVSEFGVQDSKLYYLSQNYIITKIVLAETLNLENLENTNWSLNGNTIELVNTEESRGLSISIGELIGELTDVSGSLRITRVEGYNKKIGDLIGSQEIRLDITFNTYVFSEIELSNSKYYSKYYTPKFTRAVINGNYLIYTSNEYSPTTLHLTVNAHVLDTLFDSSGVSVVINNQGKNKTILETTITGRVLNDGNSHTLFYIEAKNIVDPIRIIESSGFNYEIYYETTSHYSMNEDGDPIKIELGNSTISSYPSYGILLDGLSNALPTSSPMTDVYYYVPNANYFGDDTFKYAIEYMNGTRELNVEITVKSINDLPSAYSFPNSNYEDFVSQLELGVWSDVDSTQFTYFVSTPQSHGKLYSDLACTEEITTSTPSMLGKPNIGGIGDIVNKLVIYYKPTKNYFGNDVFGYKVEDASGGVSDEAIISLEIISVNDAPYAIYYFYDVSGKLVADLSGNTIDLSGSVVANYTMYEDTTLDLRFKVIDVDDDQTTNMRYMITEILNGELYEGTNKLNTNVIYNAYDASGRDTIKHVSFEPNLNFNGDTSFTYIGINSRDEESLLNRVNIHVIPVDDLPVPAIFEMIVEEYVRTMIDLSGSEFDGEEIQKFRIRTLPRNSYGQFYASAALYADEFSSQKLTVLSEVTKSVWIQTNLNINNPDPKIYFTYDAQQTVGNRWSTLRGTVTIDIRPKNDAPTGIDEVYN